MKEKWEVMPDSYGKYMISNLGEVAFAKGFKDGVPEKLAPTERGTFTYIVHGVKRRVLISAMVEKVFGLPCEGTECKKMECQHCGHNPAIHKQRLERLRAGDMEKNGKMLTLHLRNGL